MIVHVRSDGVALEDANTFTAFKVIAPEAARGCIDAAIAEAGRFDGEHAWIAETWLRNSATSEPETWVAGFEKMLAFAKTKGWFDDAAGAIRAHVEWQP